LSTLEALRTGTESHLLDSPDGNWQAELISQVCAPVGDESLIYYRLSLRQLGTNKTRVLVEDLGSCGLGAASYELTAWSPDSQYLYYTRRVVPDGAALIAPSTIYRLEAASGEATSLPGSGPISPDQNYIAWTDGRALVLYDLHSAGLQTYDNLLPAGLPTYLVWQPDGRAILFVQTENDSYPYGSSTVGLITLDGMTVKVLHAGDDPALIAMQGFEPGGVLIGDDQGHLWFLSIPAGELTQR
jgi:hypothetical protein